MGSAGANINIRVTNLFSPVLFCEEGYKMEVPDITVTSAKECFPELYFVDDGHAQKFFLMMAATNTYEDKNYLAPFYILSALWAKDTLQYVYVKEGRPRINTTRLRRNMGVMSSGEIAMVRLAINLFNHSLKADVYATFCYLDYNNLRVCLCAISFLFGQFYPLEYPEGKVPRCKICGSEARHFPSCGCSIRKNTPLTVISTPPK